MTAQTDLNALPWPTDADADAANGRTRDRSDKPDFHETDDAELVRRTLRKIMQDDAAPAAAKAQAARTLAEMAQLLGRHQRETADAAAPVKELSRAAMLAELAGLGGGK